MKRDVRLPLGCLTMSLEVHSNAVFCHGMQFLNVLHDDISDTYVPPPYPTASGKTFIGQRYHGKLSPKVSASIHETCSLAITNLNRISMCKQFAQRSSRQGFAMQGVFYPKEIPLQIGHYRWTSCLVKTSLIRSMHIMRAGIFYPSAAGGTCPSTNEPSRLNQRSHQRFIGPLP